MKGGYHDHPHQGGFPQLDNAYQFLATHASVDRDGLQACAELLRTMGAVFESRHTVLLENRRLGVENQRLNADNARLTAESSRTKTEMAYLKQQGQQQLMMYGGGGRPGPLPPPIEPFVLHKVETVHDQPVHSVKIATEDRGLGTAMATASWEGQLKIVDYVTEETGEWSTKATFQNYDKVKETKMGGLYSVAFAKATPDLIGCTSCDKNVYLWNTKKRECVAVLRGHGDEVNGIDFHDKQQVMCTASDDCKVIIWDYQEGITLRTLDKHTKQVYGTKFLGLDFQYLVASCCFDMKTRIFDMRDKNVVKTLDGHTDDVIGLDYSPLNHLLATGSDDGLIITYDVRTWTQQTVFKTRRPGSGYEENEVKRIAFSPDGERLAAACSSNVAMVYDCTRPSVDPLAVLSGHTDCVFDVAWSHDEKGRRFLVSASHDKSCRVWRETGA